MLFQRIISLIGKAKDKAEKWKSEKAALSDKSDKKSFEERKAEFEPLELHNTNSWIEKKFCDTYNKNLGNFGRYTEKMIPSPKTDRDYEYNMSLAVKDSVETWIATIIGLVLGLLLVYVIICIAMYAIFLVLLGIGWLANNVTFFRHLLGSGLWIIVNALRHLLPWGWFW